MTFIDCDFVALHPGRISDVKAHQTQAVFEVKTRPNVRQHRVMVSIGHARTETELLLLLTLLFLANQQSLPVPA